MTTVIDGIGRGAGDEGRPDGQGVCPHCRAEVARDVTWPWPANGMLCPLCQRGIGRGRGVVVAPGALEYEAGTPAGIAPPPPPPPEAAAQDVGYDEDVAYDEEWADDGAEPAAPVDEPRAADLDGAPAAFFDDSWLIGDDDARAALFDDWPVHDNEPPPPVYRRPVLAADPIEDWDEAADDHRADTAYDDAPQRGDDPSIADQAGGHARPAAEPRTSMRARVAAWLSTAALLLLAVLRRARALRAARRAAKAGRARPRSKGALLVRIGARLCIVLGVLIVVDATITLFWQEPISALLASRAQHRVDQQFDRMAADAAGVSASSAHAMQRHIQRAAASLNVHTPIGHAVGKIRIPRIGTSFTIVQGHDDTTLRSGPGHYPETPLPGARGHWTVGIAGHRTTFLAPFRHIDELKRGDRIFVRMPYARFTYVVTNTVIVDPDDPSILKRVGYDRLALTACNPPFSAAQRIIVYARQRTVRPA